MLRMALASAAVVWPQAPSTAANLSNLFFIPFFCFHFGGFGSRGWDRYADLPSVSTSPKESL
jgi:hypothetical protein